MQLKGWQNAGCSSYRRPRLGRETGEAKGLSKLWEIVKDREVWCAAVHRVAKSATHVSLSNQATVIWASADLGAQWDNGAPCGHAWFCTSTLGEWRVIQVVW